MFPNLGAAPSDAFLTNFSFVNLIEHKDEEIIRFYGSRENKGRCQSLARKKRLNQVFNAIGLCYANRSDPSTSLPVGDAAPYGHGTKGRRFRARMVMTGHGANTTAMESPKQKLSGRGRSVIEPTNVQIRREIAGKVGNSKKVMIG